AEPAAPEAPFVRGRSFLTPAMEFEDVSRGNPRPYSLKGAALAEARLSPQTWRLEITADPFVEKPSVNVAASLERPLTLDAGNALDLAALLDLGKKHEVHFLKA